MINSLRAQAITPWKIDQGTITHDAQPSIDSKKIQRDDAYKDRKEIVATLNTIDRKDRLIPLPKRPNIRNDILMDSSDNQDEFIGYLARIKRQQLMQLDRYRNPTNSPVKKQTSKIENQEIRLYPGITEHGIRRLLNNTLTRINREQAQKKMLATRKRKEVLEKLSEYDELPISSVLRDKYMMGQYHDLDKIPDSQLNEIRIERMLKKLDKEALSLRSSKKGSPKSFITTKDVISLTPSRKEPVNKDSFNKPTLDETIILDRHLPIINGIEGSPVKNNVLKKTEIMSLKQSPLSQKLNSLRIEYNNSLTKKRSKSALPPVKLSDMSIVKDPFPVRALEEFIYDNYETTNGSSNTSHKLNHRLPIVLASKESSKLNETIDRNDPYLTNTTTNYLDTRLDTNSILKELTSKRGIKPINSKNKSSLEKEELSGIFQDYQKELKYIQYKNSNNIKELDQLNASLNSDHGKLRTSAEKVMPLNQNELDNELESIRAAVINELQITTKIENSIAERRINRLNMLGENARKKELDDQAHKITGYEDSISADTKRRLAKKHEQKDSPKHIL